MKKSLLVFATLFSALGAGAQLYNNGATIKINNGATLFTSGNLTNAAGIITNDGRIEVQGNFTNSATYQSTSNEDSLIFTGTGPSTLQAGGATLQHLQVRKSNYAVVTLLSTTNIGSSFSLLAGTLSTDVAKANELVAPFATAFTYADSVEVIGKIRRNGWSSGVPKVFHSNKMVVTTNGGTAPTSLLVNMVPGGDPTGNEREVKRTFNFTPTGGTSYSANVSFPYKESELNTNTEATLASWYFAAAEWTTDLNRNVDSSANFITTVGIPESAFSNKEWKLADPNYAVSAKTILRGPYNSSTGLMSNALNTAGVLPLQQPYTTAPFNYAGTEQVASIPNANIVDWVLLEIRKPADGLAASAGSSTIIGRKAAFLLRDGSLADLDGTTIPLVTINKQGQSFVVVRHRNHLSAISKAIPSNPAGTFNNDFTLLTNVYKDPAASSEPVVQLPSNSLYGLWAGNANTNFSVNAADISLIKLAIASSATGYLLTDVNLSNSINAADASLAKQTIANSGTGSTAARNSSVATKAIESSVPQ